jgi:hypothetical protein
VKLLELRAQHPLHVRVDDRQRLVEQDRVDVRTHQAAPEGNLLLLVRRQSPGALARPFREIDELKRLANLAVDLGRRHAAVAQREGQIVVDRHRVVDDGELEHLGDVALLRRQVGDIRSVEQQAPLRSVQQARDDVEQRGLAAARRPQQRIGAAILEGVVHFLQCVVVVRARIGHVGVPDVIEVYACHVRLLTPPAVRPAASHGHRRRRP